MINSKMIDNHCLNALQVVSESLTHVELERCPDVTLKGVLCLARLKNLKYLRLHQLDGLTSEEWERLTLNSKDLFPNCDTVLGAADFIEAEHALPPPS